MQNECDMHATAFAYSCASLLGDVKVNQTKKSLKALVRNQFSLIRFFSCIGHTHIIILTNIYLLGGLCVNYRTSVEAVKILSVP